MPKEKRNNLAIYTLAGSVLLSSVIVSMNQSNAHSTSASKQEFNALKNCISNMQKNAVRLNEQQVRWDGDLQKWEIPLEFHRYMFASGDQVWTNFIIDNLKCK